jgi:excisionase family DNA binding protein
MKSITSIPSHQQAAHRVIGHEVEPQYLRTAEVAARLRWSKRTVREKVRAGVFRLNEHFFQPPGCQMRWKWSAVAAWLEGERTGMMVIDDVRLCRL